MKKMVNYIIIILLISISVSLLGCKNNNTSNNNNTNTNNDNSKLLIEIANKQDEIYDLTKYYQRALQSTKTQLEKDTQPIKIKMKEIEHLIYSGSLKNYNDEKKDISSKKTQAYIDYETSLKYGVNQSTAHNRYTSTINKLNNQETMLNNQWSKKLEYDRLQSSLDGLNSKYNTRVSYLESNYQNNLAKLNSQLTTLQSQLE